MSRYENELVSLTPIIWIIVQSLQLKNIVTLSGTLWCPGTQIHITFKLKKVQADKRAYFSSLAHNFFPHRGRD